ncbi:MAG: metalloregulator ArsR/SmtB family transcription factor [Alicyclobacillus sp.]|nr:metalloregulator ArsR/SmtB family transcription factor [Alicyclobacillus sp.]
MATPLAAACCATVHTDALQDCEQQLPAAVVDRVAATFKALADPTRVRILYNLSNRELCVCDLAHVLQMTQSAVSHQLGYLRALRLVTNRREGNTVYYRHDDVHTLGLLQMAIDHATHTCPEASTGE